MHLFFESTTTTTIIPSRTTTHHDHNSHNGHLSVCKWLYKVGATADVAKPNDMGTTPMMWACAEGHLSVCQWLYEVGADATTVSRGGSGPMHMACWNGHLAVCEWLLGTDAAAEIAEVDDEGDTPMRRACSNGHLAVCQCLVFHGALNRPAPPPAGDDNDNDNDNEGDEEDDGGDGGGGAAAEDTYPEEPPRELTGHCDFEIVARDIRPADEGDFMYFEEDEDNEGDSGRCRDLRPSLLSWAQQVVATHRSFFHVVLRASVIVPASPQHAAASNSRCRLPLLPRSVLQRIAAMLAVETGRRLRNVREFAEELECWISLDESSSLEESSEDERRKGDY